ncbi:hypothetical protein GJ633_10285 [Halorubrum sp. CBA1125]|uniref:hypothetical protein n=1 Tax=Halorubrum sp. CBA1125 TaxID=2668072 RepID=UPI0012E82B7C|nr:hypothetical protein [Halorubrum sp. CBA1125]MUW15006.1 hypothetical protein [Halorubrum sp. CBA1125]
MRSTLRRALRGILSGVSLLAFISLFLALQARIASPPLLAGLAAVGVVTLFAAGGRPALSRLFGRAFERDTGHDDDPEVDWWLARLEPALDDAWNRYADAVLTIGLAALGIGSFALVVAYPGEDPPLGLLVVGLFGINGALISLAFVFK